MYVLTPSAMRALEAAGDRAGLPYAQMMENAGRAVAEHILGALDSTLDHKVVILAGKGNNGGDGLAAAHYLNNAGLTVAVYAAYPLEADNPLAQRLRAHNVFVAEAPQDMQNRVLRHLTLSATVLVDAVFGTGARLPLTGPGADLLKTVHALLTKRPVPPLVVAVDCPSGVDCATGAVWPYTLRANLTVTLAAPKTGLLAFPAADFTGALQVADIGLDPALPEWQASRARLFTRDEARARTPARPRSAHKGAFGTALLVGGSTAYVGALSLAGQAAARAGAGWVTLAVPEAIHPLLAGALPDLTWQVLPHTNGQLNAEAAARLELSRVTALGVGPGLGLSPATTAFVEALLADDRIRARPCVLDADALKALSALPDWPARLPPQCVLTPHVGEMAGLTGLSREAIQSNRLEIAQTYAVRWGAVVALKGPFTVVAAPDGWASVFPFATPALARAGAGDVLTGLITGLLAHGLPPQTAAELGVWVHGRAGELAAHARGQTFTVTASAVLPHLGEAWRELV